MMNGAWSGPRTGELRVFLQPVASFLHLDRTRPGSDASLLRTGCGLRTRRPQTRIEMMEDRILIDRCRRGDELAWEALVQRYQARVCGVAYTYTGSEEEALDVAQEVFVRVWKRLDTCRDPERFESWMLQIGRNACMDFHRRRKARPPVHDIPVDEAYDLADERTGADDRAQDDSRKRLVHRALQALSEVNREILLLKDIQPFFEFLVLRIVIHRYYGSPYKYK